MKQMFALWVMLCYCPHGFSDTVVGATYPVLERDPIRMLEEKADVITEMPLQGSPSGQWQQTIQPELLPRTKNASKRGYVPEYRVEHTITDQHGNVLYPKGYLYNPLQHMSIPYRIVVVDELDADWLKPQLLDSDLVLLNKGELRGLSFRLQHRVFLADKNTISRLNVRSVPSIVTEVNDRLLIEEILNEP